jgi:hypothetical protein
MQDALDSCELVSILMEYDKITFDIHVVYLEKKYIGAVLRAFIEYLVD